MIKYNKEIAREFLITPNKEELKLYEDIKRKNALLLFALTYDKRIKKIAETLLNNPLIYKGTKEQINENLKILK